MAELASRAIKTGYKIRRRRQLRVAGPAAAVLALAIASPFVLRDAREASRISPAESPNPPAASAAVPAPDGSRPADATPRAARPTPTPRKGGTTRGAVEPGRAGEPGPGRIAFARARDGNTDLYVMAADGTGVRRVTSDTGPTHPTWSPSGEELAFVRMDGVWLVRTDGSRRRRVVAREGVYGVAWSPDGRRLAFVASDGPGGRNIYSNGRLYVVNVDGSGLRDVTGSDQGAASPVWAPDGDRIAYVIGEYKSHAVRELDLRTDERRTVGHGMWPAWSADGRLAFVSEDLRAIGVRDADGSERTIFASNDSYVNRPTWSPDGRTIVFDRDPDGHAGVGCALTTDDQSCSTAVGPAPSSIWSVGADGKGAKALTSGADDVYPAFSWS
jgi:Tol biopolymer transport system component